MQSATAAVLILSAISAVSAKFPPRTTNVDAAKSLKNIFQSMPVKTMFQLPQTTGRRLDGHDSAAMSTECQTACNTAEALQAYMLNMVAVSSGDVSSLCPHKTALACMGKEDACKDPGDEGNGMDEILCSCACPIVAKLDKLEDEDYCKPENSMSCIMTEATCSTTKKNVLDGMKEADLEKRMDIHCQKVAAKCSEKGEKLGTCAGDAWTKWMQDCEPASKKLQLDAKATACCPHLKTVLDCYTADCMKLDMQEQKLGEGSADAQEKQEIEKELEKNYHVGKVCPDSGMPASWSDVVPPTTTASSSWVSLHALAFVVMVGSLLA